VITGEARQKLLDHIAAMRARGHRVTQGAVPEGLYVPPTIIEIGAISDLPGEVFGPVLHVLRYPRERLDEVIRSVNATGFGLTFGVHSRIDETIERATALSSAGNQYVNRTVIGAVVGVQPFGGHGLSGTGPKAGGPLYLRRLLSARPAISAPTLVGELAGPVGERNGYALRPKGNILCVATDPAERQAQLDLVAATGNRIASTEDVSHLAAVLFSGSRDDLLALTGRLAARPGPIVPIYTAPYPAEFLFHEVSLSVNTAAAGGNASLMTIG
jgi:RHH-type proline utilization regulon transcriptional repressor/proline dehydrogenase/delta 1-pyrroline-5-carboxylate dehydrogenase